MNRGWCFALLLSLVALVAVGAPSVSEPVTFTITTTTDDGPGSLREAIQHCNRQGGRARIVFDLAKSDPGFVATAGIWRITFRDTPPALTVSDVTVDGASQTVRHGDTNPHGPEIVLSGGGHSIEYAFLIINAARVTIRGFVIQDFLYGIQVYGPASCSNRIVGNFIGVDETGTRATGNYNGIELLSGAHDNLVGGADPTERNLVSGNEHIGIRISDAHHNLVLGNFVGVDRTGTRAVPNHDGICVEGRSRGNLIGGPRAGERNLFSGNVAYGVDLFGVGVQENIVRGNFIGTDITGTKAIPNTYGVLFDDRSSRNLVGGTNPGEWNLISGNTAFGAYFYNNGTCSNVVQGNRIGTDASGTFAVPNETGVHIDGGTFRNVVDNNLISGNVVAGVTIFALYTDHNAITRNRIGIALDEARPLGNGADGVRIAFGPKNNLVGGSPLTANIIAHNGKNGVSIESDGAVGNRISCNSIYANEALGIDLFPEGPNPQRPAERNSGPNAGINAPLITNIQLKAGEWTVRGTVAMQPESATVEVFLADLSTLPRAQGMHFIGSTHPDATGRWEIQSRSIKPSSALTATVTDRNGNTSEFAPAVQAR